MLSRRRIYQARQRYLPYLFAAAGAILALNLVGVLRVELEPVQFVLDVNIGFPGYTTLKVPPIGSITAKTHSRQPLQLTLSLENIDLDQLRRIAATTDLKSQQALVSYFHSKINRIIGNVIFKLALIAAGEGCWGALSGARHWRILLACCLTGSLIVLICAASVYVAYDIKRLPSLSIRASSKPPRGC